jgi:hypothetical protein
MIGQNNSDQKRRQYRMQQIHKTGHTSATPHHTQRRESAISHSILLYKKKKPTSETQLLCGSACGSRLRA